MGVIVWDFVPSDLLQYGLFEDHSRKDKLRKTVYAIKNRYGSSSIVHAAELQDGDPSVKDVIGFGSVRDMYDAENLY